MHRRTWFFAPFVFIPVVACSSTADSEPGPAPTDPIVYAASGETQGSVGVSKWGYGTDDASGASIFRAYGSKNELVAEIRESFEADPSDAYTKHFTLTMTGAASGTERIDYVADWNADQSAVEYTRKVVQNDFKPGSLAAKILARVGPDSVALAAKSGPTQLSTNSLHALDDAPPTSLTTGAPEETTKDPQELVLCCQDLTTDTAQEAALTASDCSIVGTGDETTLGGGGALTQSAGIHPDELVLGKDGKPQVKSPWAGPYNIVNNHCHNAAASNASKTDGYIGCDPTSSTTSYSGHTINWAPDPSAKGAAGSFCAYEPQRNGGTAANNSLCCWSGGGVAKDGSPLFDNAASKACVTQLCLGQAKFDGKSPPTAFPAGSKPQTPNDCPGSTNDLGSCNTCCTNLANDISGKFPQNDFKTQIADYRKSCATACTDRDKIRQEQQKASKPGACLGKAIAQKGAATEQKQTCQQKK